MKEKEYFKQFDIEFGSLALGNHHKEVEIKGIFFEKYKNDDVKDCDVHVDITLERKEAMVVCSFDMQGYIVSFCDICLEDLTIPISKQEMLILKITGIARESDNETIVFVGEKENFYNIEQLMYEYIVTQIPIRKVHEETGLGTCNPDMLKRIEEIKTNSYNQVDERWEVLKEIKFE